jgi:hypothetical protein
MRVRRFLARIWYQYCPVLTTPARLDDLDMSSFARGVDFADRHPVGQIVREPQLTLVASR